MAYKGYKNKEKRQEYNRAYMKTYRAKKKAEQIEKLKQQAEKRKKFLKELDVIEAEFTELKKWGITFLRLMVNRIDSSTNRQKTINHELNEIQNSKGELYGISDKLGEVDSLFKLSDDHPENFPVHLRSSLLKDQVWSRIRLLEVADLFLRRELRQMQKSLKTVTKMNEKVKMQKSLR